jgi:hypothetical protein
VQYIKIVFTNSIFEIVDDIAIAEAINEVEDELRQNTSDSNNIIYYVVTSSIIIVIAGVVASFLM